MEAPRALRGIVRVMKATHTVPAAALDNDDRFGDPFFRQFTLRPSPRPLQLTPAIARTYRFPTLYSDVTTAIGIFPCDYARAAALLPSTDMAPVRIPRGRSVVV